MRSVFKPFQQNICKTFIKRSNNVTSSSTGFYLEKLIRNVETHGVKDDFDAFTSASIHTLPEKL